MKRLALTLLRTLICIAATVGATLVAPHRIVAQSFSGDARNIGMGSADNESNFALNFAGALQPRSYRSVVVPLGIVQPLRDFRVFDPSDSRFNPVRALDYAANPLHFTFGRNRDTAGEALVKDLLDGNLNPDLTAYHGFTPRPHFDTESLLSPAWGKTFRIKPSSGISQGLFFGAGPYIAVGSHLDIDPNLIHMLSSPDKKNTPDAHFAIADTTRLQTAGAFRAGYRVRLGLPGGGDVARGHDGVYFAANYNYLRGLRMENANMKAQFDTDDSGLVTVAPDTTPVNVDRLSSTKGRGFGIDLASGIVAGHWKAGIAAEGISNRINWQNLRTEQLTLTSIVDGSNFERSPMTPQEGTERVSLPVRYTGNVGYRSGPWSVDTSYRHGLQHSEFHCGTEYRMQRIELRGGCRYQRGIWNPTGGIGFNLTEKFGVDVAAFGSAVNLEQQRKASIAVSMRFNH